MKRAVERSKLDRKTNIELVETMWEQFCNLGIYESNVVDTTNYSFKKLFPQYKKKSQVGQRCCLRFFLLFCGILSSDRAKGESGT